MKKPAILFTAFGLSLIGSLNAQTVPLFFNYQGKIITAGGVPLGATGTAPNFTAAPINRKIIFRIYDAPTAGTLVWSEQQTVTVSLGEFSVLLGQGGPSVYNSITEPRPPFDTVFNTTGIVSPSGPGRYLEIVVDDGNGTFTPADTPIVPRQRLTTTAFAFRARMADTVPALAITTASLADGAVTAGKIADNSVTSLKIGDAQVTTAKLLDSSITAAKIADGAVGSLEIANGAVTSAKLDAGIGVWTAAGGNVSRPTGFVGIGKTPTVPLDVAGAITATGNITTTGVLSGASISTTGNFAAASITANGGVRALGGAPSAATGFAFTGGGGDSDSGMFSTADGTVQFYGNGLERFRIDDTGRVGIGQVNPLAPLHVSGSANLTFTLEGYLDGNGAGDTQQSNFTGAFSIISDAAVRAQRFLVISDARTKTNPVVSDAAADLATFMGIEITDYGFKDTVANGSARQKKVIAQQVEKVFPQAVTRTTNVIPDIYQKATFKNGWVTLTTDLKPGERVRLMGPKNDGVYEVLEVAEGRFRTAFTAGGDRVFVYGREVNDFRTVDYDAISMLNASATQQLKRENDALRQRIAELEANEKARETKLAAIEKLLQSVVSADSPPRTVSLNAGDAAK